MSRTSSKTGHAKSKLRGLQAAVSDQEWFSTEDTTYSFISP